MTRNLKFASLVIHAGQDCEQTTGAVMPPIYATSTYKQKKPGEHSGYEYSRTKNPTRTALENMVGHLEQGVAGLAFASGMAAIAATLELLEPQDHILVNEDIYGGTWRLFEKLKKKSAGLQFSYVDMRDLEAIKKEIRPNTKMFWLESPSNPMMRIIDIAAITKIAKENNIMSVVDNTFATPYLQQPLALGADIVVHSVTKFLNGHSDVVGGVLVAKDQEVHEQLAFIQNSVGSILGPFDSFLVLRGIKTLALRMKSHCQNAHVIAEYLESHDKVKEVFYPGLLSHPEHDIALKQMKLGYGGIVSFYLDASLEKTKLFLEKTQLFTLAESLGGVESLIEHPGIMTHASLSESHRDKLGIKDNLIRLSVGIEDPKDLLADLANAFAAI